MRRIPVLSPALAHNGLPSINAGTLAPWFKGASIACMIGFVQEGYLPAQKQFPGAYFLEKRK